MELNELKKYIDFEETGVKLSFKGLIGKSPEQVSKYFKDKHLVKSESWQDFEKISAPNIFTVSGVTKLDILQDIHDLVWKAIEDGTPLEEFKSALKEKLVQRGYLAGDIRIKDEAVLTEAWRVNLIYRQNIQSAYQAGRYKQMIDNRVSAPYLRYVGILDQNTRTGHAALQEYFMNRVCLYTDPIWNEIYPPCGFGCRCSVDALDYSTVLNSGLQVVKAPMSLVKYVDKGFRSNPAKKFFMPDFSKYDNTFKASIRDMKADVQTAAENITKAIQVRY